MSRARRRLSLAARADLDELLDGGSLTDSEVATNLADLARLNRLPAGTTTSVAAIARLLRARDADSTPRILDLGTGGGEMPLAFAQRGWTVEAMDLNPQALAVAREATRSVAGIRVVHGDARALPYPDAAFDVAHCSLLVHHLDPAEAVRVLSEMRRVARLGVVVNDLRRGALAGLATAVATIALGRCHVTRHDGLASARRAYTVGELDELLARAGLAACWRSAAWMPRVATAARPA